LSLHVDATFSQVQVMTKGSKVKLITFEGTTSAPNGCASEKDYWKLIGKEGQVVLDPFKCCKDDRYCDERKLWVSFDISLESLGLSAHRKNENSLWLLAADLSEIS